MKPLLSIQYLRALAALSVVAFHVCQWAGLKFDIGSAGVDVFFVISGFIMWRTTSDGQVAPLGFLKKRAIRIAPLYWLATLLLLAAALAVPERFRDIQPTPWHVTASLLFIQHLNPAGLPFPLLAPGWTLNYEVVFYLLFAGALLIAKPQRALALTVVLASFTVFGFLHPPAYIMLCNPLLLEFAAGLWLARFMEEGLVAGRHAGCMMFVGGLSAFAALHLLGFQWDLWRPLFWGFPALLVVAGLTAIEQDGGLPEIPLLKTLGDASYSIYLIHPLTVGAVAVTIGAWNTPVFLPVAFAVGAASGWLVWRFIETPVLAALRRPMAAPVVQPA